MTFNELVYYAVRYLLVGLIGFWLGRADLLAHRRRKHFKLRLGFSSRKKEREVFSMETAMKHDEIGMLEILPLGENDEVLGMEAGSLGFSLISGDATLVKVDENHIDVIPADNTVQVLTIQGTIDADPGEGVLTLAWEAVINVTARLATHVGVGFTTRPKPPVTP